MESGRVAFGEALRVAVANRGLSLGRVQAHLGAAGHPVALSTLSQWQHGRRVPASPRSFAVVDELERVLRVPAGTLRARLASRRITGEGLETQAASTVASSATNTTNASSPTPVASAHRPALPACCQIDASVPGKPASSAAGARITDPRTLFARRTFI